MCIIIPMIYATMRRAFFSVFFFKSIRSRTSHKHVDNTLYLVQRLAATWRCVLHSSAEPGELALAVHCYDDSTINIVVPIIIILLLVCRFSLSIAWSVPEILGSKSKFSEIRQNLLDAFASQIIVVWAL